MRDLIITALLWLLRRLGPSLPAPDMALLVAATAIVRALEGTPYAASFKRSKAIQRLRARFPNAKTRDLSLAIELAVRNLPRD